MLDDAGKVVDEAPVSELPPEFQVAFLSSVFQWLLPQLVLCLKSGLWEHYRELNAAREIDPGNFPAGLKTNIQGEIPSPKQIKEMIPSSDIWTPMPDKEIQPEAMALAMRLASVVLTPKR